MSHRNSPNTNTNEYDVLAIDKQFWVGKTKLTLNDIERAHADLINLQDGLNRSIRHINRKAKANFNAINRLADDVNTNSATVELQIQTILERIERLEPNNIDENDVSQHNRSVRLNDTLIRIDPFVDDNPVVINEISTLTGITGLEVFSQDSVSAFDKWARRFKDYLIVMCRNMNEEEKLDRLRLALDDTPRDLFDKLSAAETLNVETALKALKEKLDSPQRKELAKRGLVMCKQRDDEPVSIFLKRLTSLIEVAYSSLGPVQLKERLCEEFLDRQKPDLSFLIRLAGLSKEKDLELVRTQAEELELLLKTHKGQAPGLFPQLIQAIDRNPQMPSSSNQFVAQNKRPFQDQRGNQQRNNYSQRNMYNPRQNEGPKRFRSWNNNPNNERKWNSRPVCNFCKRTGHFAFNCFERKKRFNQNWRQNVNSIQENPQFPGPSNLSYPASTITVDANELLRAFASMKILPSGSKSCKDSETINSISKCEKSEKTEIENKDKPKIENIQVDTVENKILRTTNWEGIGPKLSKFLLNICMLAMIILPVLSENSSYIPKHPMICQNIKNGVLWAIPTLQECPRVSLDYLEPPVMKTLWLFAPNNFEQETSAWACRKIRKSLRKYTSITNVNIREQLDSESLEITAEECRQMIYRKKCKIGTLIEENGLWHTNVKIDNSPRTWLLGSWNWKTVASENCYLVPTKIFSKFGEKCISSPLGDIKDCSYLSGHCIMPDKTILIWKPSNDTNCEYKPMGPWKGIMMGSHWIADKAPLLLEILHNAKTVKSCNWNLTITPQGYAIGTNRFKENKPRRIRRAIEGLITSSQLAAELSYLSWNISTTLSFSFTHAMHSMCEYVEQNRRWALAASTSDPTTFSRVMFNNPYLTARKIGPGVIKVWPCVALEPRQYVFVPLEELNPVKKECFEFIPIKIDIGGEECYVRDLYVFVLTRITTR
uniref:CCHC-type domain-containing protein n=1 Tax=Meloidogyne incognita TaxID=6306 RepID=A0A914M9Q2_MELIC